MKKLLVILALIIPMMANAQEKYKVFAELLGSQKGLFSNKVTVRVDFGQNVSFWKQGDMKIVDESGKEIVFNSMVDAMNFMGRCGWNFVQAYVVSEGNQSVYHWLMSKDVASDDEIKAGFNVKSDVKKNGVSYTVTYYKKPTYKKEWDEVKTDIVEDLSSDDLKELKDKWESQTTETTEYKCSIKKTN